MYLLHVKIRVLQILYNNKDKTVILVLILPNYLPIVSG